MEVKNAKTFTEGTMTHLPLKVLIDHPEVKHRELDREHVNDLAKSIARSGLDVPLLAWNGGGDKGKQVELESGAVVPASFLIAGAHRRAAIKQIQKSDMNLYKELFPNGIPVRVLGGDLKDALAAHLRENLARKEMTAEQVLPIIMSLRDNHGMKQKDIAKSVGKSEGYISQIFDIEETLGDEAIEELEKGGVKLSKAREIAKKVKDAKKSGKPVDAKAEVKKAREKTAARKAAGKVREEKRVSAKQVWKRYNALPKMNLGARVGLLENTLGYLAGDEEFDLPKELQADAEAEAKPSKKASKKSEEDESEE